MNRRGDDEGTQCLAIAKLSRSGGGQAAVQCLGSAARQCHDSNEALDGSATAPLSAAVQRGFARCGAGQGQAETPCCCCSSLAKGRTESRTGECQGSARGPDSRGRVSSRLDFSPLLPELPLPCTQAPQTAWPLANQVRRVAVRPVERAHQRRRLPLATLSPSSRTILRPRDKGCRFRRTGGNSRCPFFFFFFFFCAGKRPVNQRGQAQANEPERGFRLASCCCFPRSVGLQTGPWPCL
ncbi:hypothetical protein V8C35DRAFT_172561 [Trichoderma chlorosporum]